MPLQICGLLLLGAVSYRQWRLTSRPRILCHYGGSQDTTNQWTFKAADQKTLHGSLLHSGYRSAGLLMLVLRDKHGKRISRIPVWRDSVSPLQFSYLNLQLMFNTH